MFAIPDTTYINGNIHAIGKKVNGKRIGIWMFEFRNGKSYTMHTYYGDSSALITRYADKGGPCGPLIAPFVNKITFYTTTDSLYKYKEEKAYIDSNYNVILHGLSKTFYPNHSIEIAGNYEHGKKKGEWKAYYPDGSIMNVVEFKDDLYHGKFVAYYQFTSKHMVIGQCFQNGQTGEWSTYHANGQIASIGNYVSPKDYIFADPFYPDAVLKNYPYLEDVLLFTSRNMPLPLKVGKWLYFDENNNIVRREKYRKGKLVKSKK